MNIRFPRLATIVSTLWLIALVLTGCNSAPEPPEAVPDRPTGSCTLELPDSSSEEDAITAVLRAEGTLMVDQAIEPLMALWAENAHVADAKNTPDNNSDDQRWLGQDAIRHRYVRTVFPGAPSAASPADLAINIDENNAVVNATTNIGTETAPAGDRWELQKTDGCWQIISLTYNLEAKPQ